MREVHTQMNTLVPLFRERLAAGQKVKFSPMGISMLPMLRQGIDSVVLSPVPEKLRKYDLPFYQRDTGEYILHRIIAVGETYTCMGDNQFTPEPGIRREQMIGLVTEFYRGEKRYSVEDLSYRQYCRIWYHSRKLRHFIRRAMGWLRRRFS